MIQSFFAGKRLGRLECIRDCIPFRGAGLPACNSRNSRSGRLGSLPHVLKSPRLMFGLVLFNDCRPLLWSCLPISLFYSQGVGGDNHFHNVSGAFQDFIHLPVAKDPGYGIFVGISIRAEHFQAQIRDFVRSAASPAASASTSAA